MVEILHPPARAYKAKDGNLWHATASFAAYEDERLYGFGQRRHGRLDQKGCVLDLRQANCEVCIPFTLSSRGYGFLWNNPALGRVELGHTGTRWVAEATHQIDYRITAGDTPAEIMRHYVDATGHATGLPEWASGFWQCKLRYKTQEELLNVAREYKKRGLPLSVIVIDFFHWPMMGDLRFDETCWPDPVGLVKELKEMGVEAMVSVWPAFNGNSANYPEFYENGYLLAVHHGLPTTLQFFDTRPEGVVYLHYYDPTNPGARALFWEKAREGYYRHGFRIFWLDCIEPEMKGPHQDNLQLHAGTGEEVACLYPIEHERAFHEGMTAAGQEKALNLCRSAWAGSQRYGAAVWSGDIKSTFEVLAKQIRAGLNIAVSGIPYRCLLPVGVDAAQAAKDGCRPRDVNAQEIRARLRQEDQRLCLDPENLPGEVQPEND